MFVVETDTTRQLLVLSVAGTVTVDESKETVARVREKLQEMAPGFVALADFRWLESMSAAAAPFVTNHTDSVDNRKSAPLRLRRSLSVATGRLPCFVPFANRVGWRSV